MDLRKLDALVAEKIMGWTDVYDQEGYEPGRPSIRDPSITTEEYNLRRKLKSTIPNYSTDIAAAWEVVLSMRQDCEFAFEQKSSGWKASFDASWMWNESATLAICLAALKAKGIDVSEWEK